MGHRQRAVNQSINPSTYCEAEPLEVVLKDSDCSIRAGRVDPPIRPPPRSVGEIYEYTIRTT